MHGKFLVPLAILLTGAIYWLIMARANSNSPSTQPSQSWPTTRDSNTQLATFAAGCFWGTQSTFERIPGVLHTRVGYTGGSLPNPTYQDVCTDTTGHAEAIQIEFDPKVITYQKLLEVFFENHDPTTVDRQGPDFGNQYRSAIFYYTPDQKSQAQAEKDKRDKSGDYVGPIVTQIVPAATFYPAEDYHQFYFDKQGATYTCHLGNGKKK